MNQTNKRKIGRIAALTLCLSLAISGCAGRSAAQKVEETTQAETEAPETEAVPVTEAETEPAEPAETTPIEYKWDPTAYSGFLKEMLGDETEQMYKDMITAMLNREEGFLCTRDFMEQLHEILSLCCPPMDELVKIGRFDQKDNMWSESNKPLGMVDVEYLKTPEEQTQILNEFGARVEELITANVRKSDTPAMAALSLFYAYSAEIVYDHEAEDADDVVDVSPYRGIMDSTGICQSFAGAYAHLCIQLGIPAACTGGLDAEFEVAHTWTQLKLDDVYYYADPTYQEGTGGVNWFGFTSKYREENDGFPEAYQNIGELNIVRADVSPVGDDRFEELQKLEKDVEIQREPGLMRLVGADDEGSIREVVIKSE